MDLLLLTLSWMLFNSILAIIPVFAGLIFLKTKHTALKIFWACIWLAFLPNTVYLLTDIFHLFDDWEKIPMSLNISMIPLYILLAILGVITFVFSLYPFAYVLKHSVKNKTYRSVIFIVLQILIGVGITLGRIQRINSWEIVTNFDKTVAALFAIFIAPDLILATLLFTLAGYLIYHNFRAVPLFVRWYKKLIGEKNKI